MDESLETHSSSAVVFTASANGAPPPFLSGLLPSFETISRATSPGLPCGERQQEDDKKRYRPRTFSYFRLLPFDVEDDSHRDAALSGILKNLYTSIMAEDFSPGAVHWTRELHGWLNLKFEMTRELRARLARLYYHLALAPGLDVNTADRFARMVITLTRFATPLLPSGSMLTFVSPTQGKSTI
jgi:proteasome activator subunit 4